MANQRDDREKKTRAKDTKQSGSANTTPMHKGRDTRETPSSGKSGGRPDEKTRNRSSAKDSHARSGDAGRDVGMPSRQTSTASEEEGQL